MSVPTLLIGCLPTYHAIGYLAPLVLPFLLFRVGIASGRPIAHDESCARTEETIVGAHTEPSP